jgi:hypothetical protein
MNPSGAMSRFDIDTDNPTPTRSVYPAAPGASIGATSNPTSFATGAMNGADSSMASAASGPANGNGVLGKPIAWWAAILVLFVGLGLVAKRAGAASDFGNIKVSAYNILMISLAAIIGITALKVVFTRFTVPGISPLIQAV